MASRRTKRSQRREDLSDDHVVVEDRDSDDGGSGVASPHQDRLDRLRHIEEGRDPEVLAANLRRLVQRKGVTRREVWTAIGEKKRAWFERVLKRGLSKVTPKGRERLEKVARFFNVTYDDLWRPDLITFEVGKPREAFQGYAEKLADLLASGKHDYLKGLIDALHGNLWRNVRAEPEAEPDEPLPPPGQRTWPSSRP